MARDLEYRVTPLPAVWPKKATPPHQRTRPPFKTTTWSRTLGLLAREVYMRGGRSAELALDIEPRHLRQDGQLRADARPKSPAVIVSFETKDGRLQFPADKYSNWQDNVEAIARSLEDLRRVDRYGVAEGRQYAGFKALPAQTGATLSTAQAADLIVRVAGGANIRAEDVLRDSTLTRELVRIAKRRTHPDTGGSAEQFAVAAAAADVLARHHGVTL
jgi:hypothetical protein